GRTAKHYYQLTTEFETIKVTEEHPIWKQGRGWTEVQYLKVDDIVASADGDVLILDNKKVDKPIEVYNFAVENTPSYFAGAGKLWVHNAKCAVTPKGTKAIAKNDNGDYVDPLDKTQTPIHIVDLPNKEKVNFVGTPIPVKLKPGTVIYRVYGGNAGKRGAYWSLEPPKSLGQTRKDLAVFEDWNDGSKIVKYEVKEGDNIGGWTGQSAPQSASNHGFSEADLPGGKDQLYIDAWNLPDSKLENVELPEGWYE
ncbi:MAG: polymorphic toxin-type HINT domain-containing protein, partial [Methylococcaceae bacterium]